MQSLNDFKIQIKNYYDTCVYKDDPNETWEDYWDMIYDTLNRRGGVVIRNGMKFVKTF